MFRQATFRWWLSGGFALEAHFGESWRAHGDIDVGIVRVDAPKLRHLLSGWDIHVAGAGALSAWRGGPIDAARSENNLWCRRSPDVPWQLDVTVGGGDERDWIYRREPTVRRSWSEAVLMTSSGVPYLAPELQLLFKSKAPRPKDNLDAATVIPQLDELRRAWLRDHLPTDHPWLRYR